MKLTIALAGLGLALSASAALADEAAPKTQIERHVMVIGTGADKLDKNGDGEVTRDEFMAPHADVFARFDADKNGKLSKAELEKSGGVWSSEDAEEHRVIMHGPGGGQGGGQMKFVAMHPGGAGPGAMDANKDGKISPEEFSAPMKEAFAAMDADKSGFLEEGERGKGPIRIERKVETKIETKIETK